MKFIIHSQYSLKSIQVVFFLLNVAKVILLFLKQHVLHPNNEISFPSFLYTFPAVFYVLSNITILQTDWNTHSHTLALQAQCQVVNRSSWPIWFIPVNTSHHCLVSVKKCCFFLPSFADYLPHHVLLFLSYILPLHLIIFDSRLQQYL